MKSVDLKEIQRFKAFSSDWFKNGSYRMLLNMNPVRVKYIKDCLSQFNNNIDLNGLEIADIGCGGGYLSLSLSRLGAKVTAVDATEENIITAKSHKNAAGINYIHGTAESLIGRQFDAVCCLEVIEHVHDPQGFISDCSKLLKPGGFLFLSTINRNLLSFVGTIIVAERILSWVPTNTHQIEKYVKPEELIKFSTRSNLIHLDTSGMLLNVFTKKWSIAYSKSPLSLAMNYIMIFRKPAS